jgi:ABC-type multidrug transport system ATPase subunit
LQGRNYKTNCCQVFLPLFVMVILLLLQLLVTAQVQASSQCGKVCPALPFPTALPPTWSVTDKKYQKDPASCYRSSSGPKLPSFPGNVTKAPFLVLDTDTSSSVPSFVSQVRAAALRTNVYSLTVSAGVSAEPVVEAIPFTGLPTLGGYVIPDRGNQPTLCKIEYFAALPAVDVRKDAADRMAVAKQIYTNWVQPGSDLIGGAQIRKLSLGASAGVDAVALHNYTLSHKLDLPAVYDFVATTVLQTLLGSAPGSEPVSKLVGVNDYPTPSAVQDFDLVSIVGPQLYFFVLHFMMPVIMSAVVYEKESKLTEITKMMGMRSDAYWIVTYFFGYLLYFAVAMTCFILGLVFKFRFFTLNTRGGMFLFLFLWGHSLSAFSLFVSVFFAKARTAAAVGYLYVIVATFLTTQLLSPYFASPTTSEGVLFIMSVLPTTALWRGLSGFSRAVSFYQPGVDFSRINDATIRVGDTMAYFVAQWVVFMALFFYLDAVWISGNGVKKEALFFLKKSYWSKSAPDASDPGDYTVSANREGEAADVAAERARVARNDPPLALRTLDLRKIYPATGGNPEKVAVQQLALGMAPGECLGFLGPNGAGKSTTINTISGLIRPSGGSATVFGLDIRRDMDRIHSLMGVCCQDDILWESLTGREHLLFYGRLKGLSGKALEEAVLSTLKSVNLHNEGSKWAGQYSGGMKRRLSVACALIGSPKIILLDEPSTGLDPASKQDLWKVILSCKGGTAMLLTTHSMEESEALCDRVAIFTDGELRTIGTPSELKALHGKGYRLDIHTSLANEARVAAFVTRDLFPPGAAVLLNSLTGHMSFEIKKASVDLANVFAVMTPRLRQDLEITEWAIVNSTLEEVFLRIEKRFRKKGKDDVADSAGDESSTTGPTPVPV